VTVNWHNDLMIIHRNNAVVVELLLMRSENRTKSVMVPGA
jgi:hypothetical protein